jgi:hypothetical protein
MVFDPDSKQNDWPMGVVQSVIKGHDGAVRRVVVRCKLNKGSKASDFERSIRQVVPSPHLVLAIYPSESMVPRG